MSDIIKTSKYISPKVPNILTMSRLLILPIFLLMPLHDSVGYRFIYVGIYIYASITDFIDGYLARAYGFSTAFGKIFDSIADKALIVVVGVLILIRDIQYGYILIIPMLIILVREFVISGIREGLASSQQSMKGLKLARYKTTVQMISLGFLLGGGQENIFLQACYYFGILTLYISTILTIITGLQYVQSMFKILNNEKK